MTVLLNGEPRAVASEVRLDQLLREEYPNLPPGGVAVAVNGEVVPRREWPRTTVASGDRIEVVHAIGGG